MEDDIFQHGTPDEIFDFIMIEFEAIFEDIDLELDNPEHKYWLDQGKALMRLCLEFFVIDRNNQTEVDHHNFYYTIMEFGYMYRCLEDKQYPKELRDRLRLLFEQFKGFNDIKISDESDENFLRSKQQFGYGMMHFRRPMAAIMDARYI